MCPRTVHPKLSLIFLRSPNPEAATTFVYLYLGDLVEDT